MRKFTLFLAFLFLVGVNFAFAQTRTISGTVTSSEDGSALPGVSVVVVGTTTGTVTDFNGKYSLPIGPNAKTLRFSFVGMTTQEVAIGASNTMNVVLKPSALAINEVVVTALGVTREKKSLGYSVSDVSGAQINSVPHDNILNALSGRAAGVQVTATSGAVGATARILIRGVSSLRSNNQPLFVVDGVPVSNATVGRLDHGSDQYGGVDFGNAISDLDPNDIASMTVLKGASAAALYGSRALNGVVLITTKKGTAKTKGIGVTYSYDVGFSNIYILPDYQNKYGQGYMGSEYYYNLYNQEYGTNLTYQQFAQGDNDWGAGFSYYNGNWGGVMDGMDESWGPRLDIGLNLTQFDSPYTLDASGHPVYTPTPWVSHPNNVRDFFITGINQTHHVSLDAGSQKAYGRISYTYNRNTGVIPNTDLTKHNMSFSGHLQMTKKLSADINFNYVNNHSNNLPGQGYDVNNVMQSLGSWFGRQINMASLKANWNTFNPWGNPYNWNSAYHNNPYWTVYHNTTSRVRNRMFGNVDLKYVLASWVNLNFRIGTDFYQERRKHVEFNQSQDYPNGYFYQTKAFRQETNADLFANFDKNITKDIRLTGLLGGNFRQNLYNYTNMQANELTVPNFFNISNAAGSPVVNMETRDREANSLYGEVNLSYKDYLFLGATGRNDWSSTLPSNNWSYFYPSVNLGFIFSDALNLKSSVFTFGKIRASYAIVGGDADPYALSNVYLASTTAFKGISQYYYTRTLANPELQPERKYSWEVGANLKFFSNRLGIDATYYDSKTKNQIMSIQVPSSSGFEYKWINAGQLSNNGIELTVYGDVFRNENGFSWRITANWAKDNNKVDKLYGDLQSFQIGSSWSGLSVQARPGETYGVIRGLGYVKDDKGRYVVDASGMPEVTQGSINLGTVSPDWTGGVANDFSYKGLTLHVMIDGRKGGDFFSVTKMFGLYSGLLKQTAQGNIRETGVVAGYNVMQQYTFVHEDGTALNTNLKDPNNKDLIDAESFYENYYGLKQESIIDGSFIKLREITLSYEFPKSLLSKQSIVKNLTVAAYVHNVALLYVDKSNDVRLDPETGYGNGNDQVGFEQYQLPPSRTFGFKLTAKF